MSIRGQGIDNLKKYLSENPGTIIVDNSQASLFERCPQAYDYRYNHHLIEQQGIAAVFSKYLIHEPFSLWYGSKGNIVWPRSHFDVVWTQICTAARYSTIVARARTNDLRIYTGATAHTMYSAYLRKFSRDFEMYQVVSSEDVYFVTFDDIPGVIYLSKPDLILAQNDSVLINADFKISQYPDQRDLLPFDRQFLGQAFASGSRIMMKNFINVFQIRETSLPHVDITRNVVPVDDDLMAEFVRDLKLTLVQIREAHKTKTYPKYAPKACYPFPKHVCPWMTLCSLGKTRSIAIEEEETENPLEYLGLE